MEICANGKRKRFNGIGLRWPKFRFWGEKYRPKFLREILSQEQKVL